MNFIVRVTHIIVGIIRQIIQMQAENEGKQLL